MKTIVTARTGLTIVAPLFALGLGAILTGDNAIGQELAWIVSIGGPKNEQPVAIVNDAGGNTYSLIRSDGGGSIQSGQLGIANGETDSTVIFKHDDRGNPLWARVVHGAHGVNPAAAAIDSAGSLYVVGRFAGEVFSRLTGDSIDTALFQNSEPPEGEIPPEDVFLIKMDGSGNVVMAKSYGGRGDQACYSIAVDSRGQIALGGRFLFEAQFGSAIFAPSEHQHSWVAKLDPSGEVQWAAAPVAAKAFLPTHEYYRIFHREWADPAGEAVGFDSRGNVIFATGYEGEYSSGGLAFSNYGGRDMLLLKYSAGGSLIWGRAGGSYWAEWQRAVAVDGNNSIYVNIGMSPRSFSAPTGTYGQVKITTTAGVLVKYDEAGESEWAVTSSAEALAVTSDGFVYTLDRPSLVKRLTSDGIIVWEKDFGPTGSAFLSSRQSGTFTLLTSELAEHLRSAFNAPMYGVSDVYLLHYSSAAPNIIVSPSEAQVRVMPHQIDRIRYGNCLLADGV